MDNARWRWYALAMLGGLVVAVALVTIPGPARDGSGYIPEARLLGFDYETYRAAGQRVLAGGPLYEARQLAGPWAFETFREPMYPPSSLALFIPASFLPAVLWWVIPVAVIAWSVKVHRPSRLALALMAVALVSRQSVLYWFVGNPGIWLAAAVAAATMWGTGPLILFKPSFFPLALIGFARRGWWWACVPVGVAVLVTLPMWLDYLTVIRNSPGVGYALAADLSLVAVPLLAWLGATSVSRRR